MPDDALTRVYSRELIALSGQAASPKRLLKPDAAAKVVSPVCGSRVAVGLALQDGKVAAFGYEAEGSVLTQAVVAVMAKAIVGKTRAEVARAGEELRAMLEAGGPPPSGDWRELKILAPVIEYSSRHDSVMLPFEAVQKAFEKKGGEK